MREGEGACSITHYHGNVQLIQLTLINYSLVLIDGGMSPYTYILCDVSVYLFPQEMDDLSSVQPVLPKDATVAASPDDSDTDQS